MSDKLKLKPIAQKNVIINGTCATSTMKSRDVVKLNIRPSEPNINICVIATVLDKICHPISRQPVRTAVHEYRHLRGLKLADYHQDDAAIKIDILLGADHYYEFVTNVIRRGDAKTPVAVKSKLGWLFSGPMGGDNFTNTFVTTTHTLKCSETEIINPIHQLNDNMNKFWDLETIGIRNEESSVCERFLDDIKYDQVNSFYEVKLPWKPDHGYLPDNYNDAWRRLSSQLNRLKRQPKMLKEYLDIITEQLNDGIIERCDEIPNKNITHYLPHRGVVRENSTSTKLRVVYDASSKLTKHQYSLNDCLFKGPSLSPFLFDILLRRGAVVKCVDISTNLYVNI